jgi:integrase
MSGTVRKRGSTWSVIYDEGRDDTGRRVQRWKGGYATKRDAEAALTAFRYSMQAGDYVRPTADTFGAFLDGWLETVEPQLRPSTFASYTMIVARHVKPALGLVKIQELTALQLNAAYAKMLKTGAVHAKTTRGLSPRTVRYTHTIVRKALADAVKWNLIPRNVADAANPPARRPRPKRTWTADELLRFLDHVRDDRLYAAFLLAATTGMRRGEILGLPWSAVDLDTGKLSVSRSLVSVDYSVRVSEPKTARGRRVVALDPATVQALRHHHGRQLEERVAADDWRNADDLVFTRDDGSPIHPQAFSEAFKRHAVAARLPTLSLHGLRHTHATLALRAGVHPKVVSERLGHASVAFTLDVYTDALPDMQETAAALVAALVLEPQEAGR